MTDFVNDVLTHVLAGKPLPSIHGEIPPRPNYQRAKEQRQVSATIQSSRPPQLSAAKEDPYAFLRSTMVVADKPVSIMQKPMHSPAMAIRPSLSEQAALIDTPSAKFAQAVGIRVKSGESIGIIQSDQAKIFPLLVVDELLASWSLSNSKFAFTPDNGGRIFFGFAAEKTVAAKAIRCFEERDFSFCQGDILARDKVSSFLSRHLKLSTRQPMAAGEATDELSAWVGINRYYQEKPDSMLTFQFLFGALIVQGELQESMDALRQMTKGWVG